MLEKHYNNYKEIYTLYNNKKKISSSKSKIKLYNKVVKCAHLLLKVKHRKEYMTWYGIFVLCDPYKIVKDKLFLKCYKSEYKLKYLLDFLLFKYRIILYKTNIRYEDFYTAPIHNRVVVIYKEKDGFGFYKGIKWNFFLKNNTKYNSSKIKIIKDINTSIYVRQSSNNGLYITARIINDTDNFIEQIKINISYLISKLFKNKIILMYEKDSFKYEESASVVYEKLIDMKYKNVRYVINKNSPHVKNIPDKYKKYVIYKNTMKHYITFFRTKSFIGTEAPAHSISLRIKNKYAEQKLQKKDYECVFLQHGVMYMVSLASGTRKSFRRGNLMPEHAKIVVSSHLEAEHFITDGNYLKSDLYITGLPKFDRTYRNDNADKIIIMPTWRPWEYNQIRSDVKNTKYYNMLLDIIESIPKDLEDKIIVLPHPLFLECVKDFPIKLPEFTTYDELLRDCSILITDYSSIAYDAYFRGANVIFWWKEKDECMENYDGHLMINENNIYGPICKTKSKLNKEIIKLYKKEQSKKYLNKFNKIVEFHDYKNTERLINCLKKDNII